MKISFSVKRDVPSAAVFLYFVMLVIHNLYQTAVLEWAWYAVLGVCFALGVTARRHHFSYRFALLVLLFVLFALLNYALVGNAALTHIVFALVYAGIYRLLTDDSIDERYILAAVYVDCAVVAFTILRTGLGTRIFTDLSNNFISVMLLLPTITYYIRNEYYQRKISLAPAVAVTVVCVLAMGRGGIITSALLTAFLVWHVTHSDQNWKSRHNQTMIRILLAFLALVLLAVVISYLDIIKSFKAFERFTKYGIYGTGRSGIWEEYFSAMKTSLSNLFLGVKYTDLPLMVRYRNNLHNSFLNIHADYGLIVLIYVVYLIISNCVKCIRQKRWIYLAVMVVFFVRAFSDKIFGGGSVATPILFFVLLFIHDKKQKAIPARRRFN